MSNQIEIETATPSVTVDSTIDIVSRADALELSTEEVKQVQINPNNYVISTGGIYGQNNTTDDLPSWISDAIDNAIKDGNVTVEALLNDLNTYIANIESGVNQSIASLQDADKAINSLITTNKTSNDEALAAVSNSNTTKITSEEAEAIAADLIKAEFTGTGGVDAQAWFIGVNEAYANETSANSSSLATLNSVITHPDTGVTATATAVDQIYTSTGMNPDGSLNGTAGHFYDLNVAIDGVGATLATVDTIDVSGTDWYVGSSKLAINSQTGGITGWSFSDGSALQSEFKVQADNFKVTSADGTHTPLSIDAVSGQSVFNGRVVFTSGGSTTTGTINEAITANIEQVQVGDKNINITDNLIPTTSLLTDVNNSGYQFHGDPIKASAAGIDTFAEPQVVIDADDEVYSPYLDELTAAYYFRVGLYGITDLSSCSIVTLDNLNAITSQSIVMNLLDSHVMLASNWYILDGIINPSGGDNTSFSGSLRLADGTKVGEIQNVAMPADAEKLILGWVNNVTISRMKLAKITADTQTGSVASTDYVNGITDSLALSDMSNVTTIDGGKITTGKIQSANTNTYFDLANNQIKMDNGSFVLDSTAAGTSVDPNIQGAYIKGGTISSETDISGSTLIYDNVRIRSEHQAGLLCPASYMTNADNYSATSGSRTVYSEYLYTKTGATFDSKRIAKVNATFTIFSLGFQYYHGTEGNVALSYPVTVQYSIDDATFITTVRNGTVVITLPIGSSKIRFKGYVPDSYGSYGGVESVRLSVTVENTI